MQSLSPLAERAAVELMRRGQTIGVAESSSGGLISAALLSVSGASKYFIGGGVIYTARARHRLLGLDRDDVAGLRSSSEPYALLLARTAKSLLQADWGLSETGAAGPTGNPYGDAAGHSCVGLAGPIEVVRTIETGQPSRHDNMYEFAKAALTLLVEALEG